MELLLLFGLCTVIFSNKKVVVVVCLWWWRTSLGLIVLFSCFKLLFVRWLVCFWLFCVMFHEGFFGVRSFAGLKFRSREFKIGEMIPPKIWCLNFRAIKEKKGRFHPTQQLPDKYRHTQRQTHGAIVITLATTIIITIK